MNPYEYPRPNKERAKLAMLFLNIMIIFHAAGLILKLFLSNAVQPGSLRIQPVVIAASGVLGLLQTAVYVLSAVFFIQWFRRAYNNLHLMGSRNLEFSEGWAAGAWFVPFMNLGRPYKIMREIWVETQLMGREPNDGYTEKPSGMVGWWWASWLSAAIIAQIAAYGQMSNTLSRRIFTPGPGYYLGLSVSEALYVVAGLLLVRIIRTVSGWEDELMIRYNNYQALRQQQEYSQQQQDQ